MKGKLFLIPTPIGNQDFDHLFPTWNSQIIQNINYFIVEDLRTGRRSVKSLGMQRSIDSLHFFQLNEHTRPA